MGKVMFLLNCCEANFDKRFFFFQIKFTEVYTYCLCLCVKSVIYLIVLFLVNSNHNAKVQMGMMGWDEKKKQANT